MHYTNYFKEIARTAKDEGIYIGMGNPNGKILVIGKELAIDEEKEKHVSDKTLKRNPADWVYNIENPQEEIPNCESNEKLSLFNPLFPYKGMETKQQPAGHTWRKYQLLYEELSDFIEFTYEDDEMDIALVKNFLEEAANYTKRKMGV
jgi:hypothetical protein